MSSIQNLLPKVLLLFWEKTWHNFWHILNFHRFVCDVLPPFIHWKLFPCPQYWYSVAVSVKLLFKFVNPEYPVTRFNSPVETFTSSWSFAATNLFAMKLHRSWPSAFSGFQRGWQMPPPQFDYMSPRGFMPSPVRMGPPPPSQTPPAQVSPWCMLPVCDRHYVFHFCFDRTAFIHVWTISPRYDIVVFSN